jgi:hypothetical protein
MENTKQVNTVDEFGDLPSTSEMLNEFTSVMKQLASGPVGDNPWLAYRVLLQIVRSVDYYADWCDAKVTYQSDYIRKTTFGDSEIGQVKFDRAEAIFKKRCYEQSQVQELVVELKDVFNSLVKNDLLYENDYTGELDEFAPYSKKDTKKKEKVKEIKKEDYLIEQRKRELLSITN